MRNPLILIDVHNLAFRAHYACSGLSNSEGEPTAVLYGVMRAVDDLRENVSKRILFCWDHGGMPAATRKPRNWRDTLIPEYKAKRIANAETARCVSQFKILDRAIRLLGYESVAVPGMEADDVIGVLSSGPGEKLIFSTDQDFYQLLDEGRVHILIPKKSGGQFKTVFQSDVERTFGFPVSRWAEYLALGGDKSDNIKPARGMGPKTAAKLILGGADLRKPLEEQPPAIRAKYEAVWEAIGKSYTAARLPRRWSDPRLKDFVKSLPMATLRADGKQRWADRSKSLKDFSEICADRDLVTVLAMRHRLFS